MAADTLESLTARVEALERELLVQKGQSDPVKDWRLAIGMFEESEFTQDRIAETLAIRERERQAVREGREV